MTQQEQFEAWLSINTPCCSEYNRQQIEWLMWQAWQASRVALVVNLGSAQNTSFEEWQVYHEDEIKDELKRLGVSYE